MKQKAVIIGVFLCLILAGIGGSYFVMHRQITHRTVVIIQDGNELYRIAMDTVEEPYTIDIPGKDGAWNRVSISREAVKMESAAVRMDFVYIRVRFRMVFCQLSVCQIGCRFKL